MLALVSTGCVNLDPAALPNSVLDVENRNGWVRDTANSTGVQGGYFSKQAVKAYRDDATDDRGFKGFVQIVSLRGMLSPDREELQERVEQRLRENAEAKGLRLDQRVQEGQRNLANGALSFFVVFNATATESEGFFTSNMRVKIIGEVFRCTGGATVIASGSAQVEGETSSSIGGVQTDREYKPRTWAEIVRDPQGSIEGFQGGDGLIHNIRCG